MNKVLTMQLHNYNAHMYVRTYVHIYFVSVLYMWSHLKLLYRIQKYSIIFKSDYKPSSII